MKFDRSTGVQHPCQISQLTSDRPRWN